VGGKGTGKTSLLRLLLESADISPSASIDQRAVLDRFLRGPTKATQSIQTVCLEICESKFDRVLFSVVDTPGLDFLEGRELKLERQVNGIIKYVDAQYADTMNEVRFFRQRQKFSIFIASGIQSCSEEQGRSAYPPVRVFVSVS